MEKNFVSLDQLLAEAKQAGMQQSAIPFKQFDVKTSELRSALRTQTLGKTSSGREVYAFNIQGFTLKYDASLKDSVATSESVTIGFFQSDIEQADKTKKSVSWIRIIACD